MFKAKKNFNSKAQKLKNAISLKHLAQNLGVNEGELMFAVAETDDGDGLFDKHPVALIVGTDEYLDLLDGARKKNARSRGLKQNFFDCYVKRDGENFLFSSPQIETSISCQTLISNFGKAVLTTL